MQFKKLVGKQQLSERLSTARINVWEGSVRSSKTISSLMRWMRYVRAAPPGNLLMVGKTERTLKRNIIDPLIELVGAKRAKHIVGAGELWLFGRRIYVAGANNELAKDKIQGLTLLAAYVDEASTIPESFWSMLMTRLSEDDATLFATTNPDNPSHWLKRDWLDRACLWVDRDGEIHRDSGGLDLHRFTFQISDNPTLSPAYVKALGQEFVGLWHRRYILGEWVVAEGAVYDMWDPDRHVVDILPPITWWIGAGVDYGTTNAFSAHLLGLGQDGRLYLTHEYRYDSRRARRSKTSSEYSEAFRAWLASAQRPHEGGHGIRPDWIYVDPAAADFSLQLHRDGMSNVAHADNEVLPGIRTMASLLGRGQLLVHRSCEGLIKEFPGYCWDDKAAAKGEDKPIKVNDHSLDDSRYVVHSTETLWRPQLALEAA